MVTLEQGPKLCSCDWFLDIYIHVCSSFSVLVSSFCLSVFEIFISRSRFDKFYVKYSETKHSSSFSGMS